MGSINSHDHGEPEASCPAVAGTPVCRDFSYLEDPRSPTLEIVRTPLEVAPTRHSRLRRLVSLLDPRSPSQLVSRTPLQVPQESIQRPLVCAPPQELCLDLTIDLGTIDMDSQVSVEVKDEEPMEQTDLKTARALFFGDMSATASPISSPISKVEPSPIKMEEVLDSVEDLESEDDVVVKSQADVVTVTEVPCVAEAMVSTKPALGAVKCMEVSTPTLLGRRQGKENTLQKQLFHTPDKTRVRTPLGNVSSFHNSPLRR